jgi:hypothetical protein
LVPPAEVRSHAFSKWYEGDGKALSGNRAFEAMRVPNMILTETYELIQARASSGASPQELEDLLEVGDGVEREADATLRPRCGWFLRGERLSNSAPHSPARITRRGISLRRSERRHEEGQDPVPECFHSMLTFHRLGRRPRSG